MMFKRPWAHCLLSVSLLALPLSQAVAAVDAVGDNTGIHDIHIVEGTWDPSTRDLVMSAVFASPVSASTPAHLGATELLGAFLIDTNSAGNVDYSSTLLWATSINYSVNLTGARAGGVSGIEVPVFLASDSPFAAPQSWVPITFSVLPSGQGQVDIVLNLTTDLASPAALATDLINIGMLAQDRNFITSDTGPDLGPAVASVSVGAPVPEPSTALLLSLGMAALAVQRRRSA